MKKDMFNSMLSSAIEYAKRLDLYWEKPNKYRKKKLRNSVDVLTATYIIHGGSEEGSTFKAIFLANAMKEAEFDFNKTNKLVEACPNF